MVNKLLVGLIGLSLHIAAAAEHQHQTISVELDRGALGSNLLSVHPLAVIECRDYHVREHHRQTSIIDSHVSTIEFTASDCEDDYSIEYRYDLLATRADKQFCAYQLRIRASSATEMPQPSIIGDCQFTVRAVQLSGSGEYVYTVSDH